MPTAYRPSPPSTPPPAPIAPRRTLSARMAAAEARFKANAATYSDVTRATYRVLLEAETTLTAYDLIEALQARLAKRLHPPTIYRALSQLIGQGLVHRIESTNTYFACTAPEAPHDGVNFVCVRCGAVEEAIEPRVAALVDEAARDRGFAPERPVIEVRGVCRNCHGQ